mmetsp:Transcript_57465/g.131958  ORF Transcript_57465/g.131958 Transcript_57465/m.131958 type:complete len:226 (-) Transcript_57465:283-960(-)
MGARVACLSFSAENSAGHTSSFSAADSAPPLVKPLTPVTFSAGVCGLVVVAIVRGLTRGLVALPVLPLPGAFSKREAAISMRGDVFVRPRVPVREREMSSSSSACAGSATSWAAAFSCASFSTAAFSAAARSFFSRSKRAVIGSSAASSRSASRAASAAAAFTARRSERRSFSVACALAFSSALATSSSEALMTSMSSVFGLRTSRPDLRCVEVSVRTRVLLETA